ncbi:MAG: hypothetical protein COB54_07595 [Alphaproteobacteria bacterium]|nr:MAG: hypothetical protein COB54_07595 [Alphaproteobacteria bacterium]
MRYLLACIFTFYCFAASAQTLKVFHIDVNQGDATLIVAPNGRTLLIDSGGNGRGRQIVAVMQAEGLNRIDHYVTTHYHEDHYGGIDEVVAAGIPVIQAYDRGHKEDEAGDRFDEYQTSVGEDAIVLVPGTLIKLDADMKITTISSSGAVLGDNHPLTTDDENDLSASLLIEYGNFSMFVGGDIHSPIEQKIAATNVVKNVDVYQGNHHGSHTSSDKAFLDVMLPQVVVISNGDHGGHRHPRQVTLDTLEGLNPTPTIFQTNKLIKVGATGGNVPDMFIADLDPRDFEGTIQIDVDQTKGTFTVSYRNGATSIEFLIDPPVTQAISGAGGVLIASVLPNPVGSDKDLEVVVLVNNTTNIISLEGWVLRDAAGLTWELNASHSLPPGMQLSLVRNGQAMSLNNGGDEISLIDSSGKLRDLFAYSGSSEGTVIETHH